MMWNLFKRKSADQYDPNQVGLLQRLAMKKVMNMTEEEREKLIQKALSPENLEKNKDKILQVMEAMKASGQISDTQIEEAKKRLGL